MPCAGIGAVPVFWDEVSKSLTHSADQRFMIANVESRINQALRVLLAVAPAMVRREQYEDLIAVANRAAKRGYFTPDEDEVLQHTFARYLLSREALHEVIVDLRPLTENAGLLDLPTQKKAFILAYTAACLLFNAGHFVVGEAIQNKVLMQKLDAEERRFGISRKQMTELYRSLTSPKNNYIFAKAMTYAKEIRKELEAIADTHELKQILTWLDYAEGKITSDFSEYLNQRLAFRWHSFKRRNLSGLQKASFALLEYSGRLLSELVNPFRGKDVTPQVVEEIKTLLRPGDVLVTRHKQVATNLFLPGFWPHAALYIGDSTAPENNAVTVPGDIRSRWSPGIDILESRKDGVLLREIADTLRVDYFTVIRPTVSEADIVNALSKALTHEGKLYDFSFDFTRADRLVCTEVIYRSFHGVGGLDFRLTLRAGRHTFSAMDLLNKAMSSQGYEVLATFGLSKGRQVIYADEAKQLLAQSLL